MAYSLFGLPIYGNVVMGPTAIGLGAAAYLYACHGLAGAPEAVWISWLGGRALGACGRLSYEIYLFHGILILFLLRVYQSAVYPTLASIAWTAVYYGGTFGVACLVAKFYSEPAGRILRRSLSEPKR